MREKLFQNRSVEDVFFNISLKDCQISTWNLISAKEGEQEKLELTMELDIG